MPMGDDKDKGKKATSFLDPSRKQWFFYGADKKKKNDEHPRHPTWRTLITILIAIGLFVLFPLDKQGIFMKKETIDDVPPLSEMCFESFADSLTSKKMAGVNVTRGYSGMPKVGIANWELHLSSSSSNDVVISAKTAKQAVILALARHGDSVLDFFRFMAIGTLSIPSTDIVIKLPNIDQRCLDDPGLLGFSVSHFVLSAPSLANEGMVGETQHSIVGISNGTEKVAELETAENIFVVDGLELKYYEEKKAEALGWTTFAAVIASGVGVAFYILAPRFELEGHVYHQTPLKKMSFLNQKHWTPIGTTPASVGLVGIMIIGWLYIPMIFSGELDNSNLGHALGWGYLSLFVILTGIHAVVYRANPGRNKDKEKRMFIERNSEPIFYIIIVLCGAIIVGMTVAVTLLALSFDVTKSIGPLSRIFIGLSYGFIIMRTPTDSKGKIIPPVRYDEVQRVLFLRYILIKGDFERFERKFKNGREWKNVDEWRKDIGKWMEGWYFFPNGPSIARKNYGEEDIEDKHKDTYTTVDARPKGYSANAMHIEFLMWIVFLVLFNFIGGEDDSVSIQLWGPAIIVLAAGIRLTPRVDAVLSGDMLRIHCKNATKKVLRIFTIKNENLVDRERAAISALAEVPTTSPFTWNAIYDCSGMSPSRKFGGDDGNPDYPSDDDYYSYYDYYSSAYSSSSSTSKNSSDLEKGEGKLKYNNIAGPDLNKKVENLTSKEKLYHVVHCFRNQN